MLLVFVSAIMVVFQVFEYRQDYRELSTYMRERDDLNAEWGRLLIEQQTFGATATNWNTCSYSITHVFASCSTNRCYFIATDFRTEKIG